MSSSHNPQRPYPALACLPWVHTNSSAALGALFREGALALRYCHIGELRPPLESHTKHVLGSLSQSAGRGPVHHLLRVLAQAHVEVGKATLIASLP